MEANTFNPINWDLLGVYNIFNRYLGKSEIDIVIDFVISQNYITVNCISTGAQQLSFLHTSNQSAVLS